MTKDPDPQGEGNYEATRDYNERTKRFIDSGKVAEAAKQAAPRSVAEEAEMRDAEAAGKSRAKEEDPAVLKAKPKPGSRPA